MKNIEIKCPLPNPEALSDRLIASGASLQWTRRQEDTFFESSRGWLKLREEEGRAPELISYIRSTDSTVRASEYDIAPLEDAAFWKRLLDRALPIEAVVRKQRTLWLLDHTRIHLDDVESLGTFLELETVAGDITLAEARSEAESIIDGLALDRSTFISVPYRDLLDSSP